MKAIASRGNAQFQALRRLAQTRTERRTAGATLIEGVHLCQEYLAARGSPRQLVCSEGALANAEVRTLREKLTGVATVLLDDALFGAVSRLENGVGVAFVIDVEAKAPVALNGDAVLIDRLQDPGNLGSILRSAAAAGVRHVYCSRGTVEAWSPKVVRAAMGAHFHLELYEDCDLLAIALGTSVQLFATSSHAPASLFETSLAQPAAWIFGNEGQGVEPELVARCRVLAIPQPGGLESLNVAAAAAICLFEQVRQKVR